MCHSGTPVYVTTEHKMLFLSCLLLLTSTLHELNTEMSHNVTDCIFIL